MNGLGSDEARGLKMTLALKIQRTQDGENNFPQSIAPNRPAKFRPETTLGGMIILRERSVAAYHFGHWALCCRLEIRTQQTAVSTEKSGVAGRRLLTSLLSYHH